MAVDFIFNFPGFTFAFWSFVFFFANWTTSALCLSVSPGSLFLKLVTSFEALTLLFKFFSKALIFYRRV